MERRCEQCGEPLEGRKGKRFCGSACRVAAHRSAGNAARASAEDPVLLDLLDAVAKVTLEPRLVAHVAAAGANGQHPEHDRMDVFMRGSDNACWYRSFDGHRWSQWVSLGGVLTSDPSAMAAGGVAWVFVRGTDNAIYHLWTRGPGQPGSGWQRIE